MEVYFFTLAVTLSALNYYPRYTVSLNINYRSTTAAMSQLIPFSTCASCQQQLLPIQKAILLFFTHLAAFSLITVLLSFLHPMYICASVPHSHKIQLLDSPSSAFAQSLLYFTANKKNFHLEVSYQFSVC